MAHHTVDEIEYEGLADAPRESFLSDIAARAQPSEPYQCSSIWLPVLWLASVSTPSCSLSTLSRYLFFSLFCVLSFVKLL
jgi:hypothetical protein